MDINDLEDDYKKKLEILEKIFLNGLKLDKKKAESNYKTNTKKLREWYYNELKKTIKTSQKVKKNYEKKEVFKRFKLKKTNIEISNIEKIKLKISSKLFKISIKIKNIFDMIYYPVIAYYFKIIKSEAIILYKSIKIFFIKLKKKISRIINKFTNSIKKIKELFLKIVNLVKIRKNIPSSDQNKDKPAQN